MRLLRTLVLATVFALSFLASVIAVSADPGRPVDAMSGSACAESEAASPGDPGGGP